VLWHELALLIVGLLILAITWRAANQVGTSTYLVLWIMRTSAKLNLYLGVRNLSEAFLPAHMRYLESFFKRRRMNAFFPFAVTVAFIGLQWILMAGEHPLAQPAEKVGSLLVGSLLALAILEHFMLVLPLDTTALWRWALRKPQNPVLGLPHLDSHDPSLPI